MDPRGEVYLRWGQVGPAGLLLGLLTIGVVFLAVWSTAQAATLCETNLGVLWGTQSVSGETTGEFRQDQNGNWFWDTDCLSRERADTSARRYTFGLQNASDVTFRATFYPNNGPDYFFYTHLYLFDAGGTKLEESSIDWNAQQAVINRRAADGDALPAGVYTVEVTSSSDDYWSIGTFDLTLTAPAAPAAEVEFSVAENQTGANVGDLGGEHSLSGTLTYTLSGLDHDATSPLFAMSATTAGQLELASGVALDYENPQSADGDNTYDLLVAVNDGTTTEDIAVTVQVTNEVEQPDAPGKPTVAQVDQIRDLILAVSWQPPAAGTADPPEAYDLRHRTTGASWPAAPQITGISEPSYQITGLVVGTYEIQVRSTAGQLASAWSATSDSASLVANADAPEFAQDSVSFSDVAEDIGAQEVPTPTPPIDIGAQEVHDYRHRSRWR